METRYHLRPGEKMMFEYTLSISVDNMGNPLNEEEATLEAQRKDTIERIERRVNEFFDAVELMEF